MSLVLDRLGRGDDWSRVHAVVGGLAVSGYAAADALVQHGARVSVLDDADDDELREKATILAVLGAMVRLGPGSTAELPADADVVVVTPGMPPRIPLLVQAVQRGVPIWGEVELAWRLRTVRHEEASPAPWLCVTGSNGKTTTVQLLDAMLRAAGLRSRAVGNVGTPLSQAVLDPVGVDVFAVELSSFQLHWSHTVAPQASLVLNVAADHLDWYAGSPGAAPQTAMADYVRDKGRVYARTEAACVYHLADPVTEQLVRDAEVAPGCRAVGYGTRIPPVGAVGVVDDVIVDRAFVEQRQTSAVELASVHDLAPLTPHTLADAVAAAALARAHGVAPTAVRDGLRAFRPGAHRISEVAVVDEVRFVDDSKATNPHAAEASLSGFDPVVWVAGGLAKGAEFDDLVRAVADRLRGVVLIGRDRAVVAAAMRRHAPDVPVIDAGDRETGETSVMDWVVQAAAGLARPGDTVLLAPACASQDMFRDYGARGDAFAAAVRRRAGG
ncbi:MAG: UDP-N-acetylmuramoyl-L-alanine--D-glutamate ligase [Nocardioidaceae bacterium]|nr:UDP-N-acetylmuramoyl-L-alanine--D-glutamate ligase [Nocardioidaceae bacterium]